jgi:fatty acid desaturase
MEEQIQKQPYFVLANSERKYLRFVQIGVLLLVIGLIWITFIRGFGPRDSEYMQTSPTELSRQLATIGVIIYYVGFALLLLGLFSLALLTKEMHIYLRIGLLIAFALIFSGGINTTNYLLTSAYW